MKKDAFFQKLGFLKQEAQLDTKINVSIETNAHVLESKRSAPLGSSPSALITRVSASPLHPYQTPEIAVL